MTYLDGNHTVILFHTYFNGSCPVSGDEDPITIGWSGDSCSRPGKFWAIRNFVGDIRISVFLSYKSTFAFLIQVSLVDRLFDYA
jgi:hypothetical protein